MPMLSKLFVVWMAMAMVATALVVTPNITSRSARSLHKRTPLPHKFGAHTPNTMREFKGVQENTYTTQQMEQFQQGHNDALMMCNIVIQEANANPPDRFDRIFREYFEFSDRQLVIDVFKAILDDDGERKGNPKFEDIDLEDDFTAPVGDQATWCEQGQERCSAIRIPKKWDVAYNREQLILCPPFWKYGAFIGGPNRQWEGVKNRQCSDVGYRVSRMMDTAGVILLHEYTHFGILVQPPMKGDILDHAYFYHGSRQLLLKEPKKAKFNADNYATFASELTWSRICKRDFEAPTDDTSLNTAATDPKAVDPKAADPKAVGTKAADPKAVGTKATDIKQRSPRHDIQLAPLLDKRTAFSQPYQHPIPKTNVENTYTVEQMDQFLEGHVDALQLCRVAIKQSTKNPTRFDKIFRQYFAPKDRALVINVFKTILDVRGTNQGSPKLSLLQIIDDFKPDADAAKRHNFPKDRHCWPWNYARTMASTTPTKMILCPIFFNRGAIDAGLSKGLPPGYSKPRDTAESRTCDTIGTRVGPDMATRGHTMLHEHTHATEIMQSIFGNGQSRLGRTDDHAYGFDGCRNLDKSYAWENGDSYSSFASELFWTTMCDRDFDPPVPVGPKLSPDEMRDLFAQGESAAKGESSAKGEPAAKGKSPAKRDSTAQDDSAASRDVAAEGASTLKGTPSTTGV